MPVQMSAFTSSAIKGSAVATGSTQARLLFSLHMTLHRKMETEARQETFALPEQTGAKMCVLVWFCATLCSAMSNMMH